MAVRGSTAGGLRPSFTEKADSAVRQVSASRRSIEPSGNCHHQRLPAELGTIRASGSVTRSASVMVPAQIQGTGAALGHILFPPLLGVGSRFSTNALGAAGWATASDNGRSLSPPTSRPGSRRGVARPRRRARGWPSARSAPRGPLTGAHFLGARVLVDLIYVKDGQERPILTIVQECPDYRAEARDPAAGD